MRIEGQSNFLMEKLAKGSMGGKSIDTFASVMKQSQSKLQHESLNQLMNLVDSQGQKLAKQRTLENLRDYKKIIKQFVGESLSYGLQLSEKQSNYPYGAMKTHQVVEVIDQKLMELHDEVLKNEEDGIDILHLVGEIRGLIINLYM